jgi:hypothetical protein
MRHYGYRFRILTILLASLTAASASGETLFVDEFEGPVLNPIWQASLPSAPWRFDAGVAFFEGASGFTFQSLNGRSVIRLQNVLGDAQRKGWSSSTTFPTDEPIVYQARFNTLVQSPTTAIDELLEIWLLDAANPANYDIVALTAPDYGRERIFTSGSSISGAGLDTQFPFENNTWYRMVISGSKTQEVRASIYNDAGTVELMAVNLGHTLSAYASGFKIGISQSMGLPGAPYPTDVALDSVRLTTTAADDADGDGVGDDKDLCRDSDLSATVVVGDCDSGVANPTFPSGCTNADFTAACAEGVKTRSRFLNCVATLTSDLKRSRIITGPQKGAIQFCAGHGRPLPKGIGAE